MRSVSIASPFDGYSEQDTADELILPYLATTHGFPTPDSLDYQAQDQLATKPGKTGRYDGLYSARGYPYVVLEAKRQVHDLDDDDVRQARLYATSDFFEKPVPLFVVSNGRTHQLYRHTTTIDPADQKPIYSQIPAMGC